MIPDLTPAEWAMAEALHLGPKVRAGDARYIDLVKRRAADPAARRAAKPRRALGTPRPEG
jgi:hypothetical protein